MQPKSQMPEKRGMTGRPDIQARPKVGEEKVAEILESRREEITALFANDPNPAAMYTRAKALAVSAYRKVQQDSDDRINEESAVAVCLYAMQRKLDPGTDVYLAPFGGKVTAILSPQGVIKLIMRSGFVLSVTARTVFDGEEFDYMLGSEEWVRHKKNNKRPLAAKDNRGQVAASQETRDAVKFAYCIFDLKGGVKKIEVIDKADIEYYRSLSPTGSSSKSGWAKFYAEFARKAVLKQLARFVPQESEVSVLLSSDDTERGIEIPDDFMKAVGARVVNELIGDQGNGAPAAKKSDPAAVPPNPAAPAPQNGPAKGPQPGDPSKVFMPGKKGEVPTVAEASDGMLQSFEKRMRESFDAGKWDDKYRTINTTQLATIRAEMKRRELYHPNHAEFGTGHTVNRLTPEAIAYGERRYRLVHAARDAMNPADDRDPDNLTNEELESIIAESGADVNIAIEDVALEGAESVEMYAQQYKA